MLRRFPGKHSSDAAWPRPSTPLPSTDVVWCKTFLRIFPNQWGPPCRQRRMKRHKHFILRLLFSNQSIYDLASHRTLIQLSQPGNRLPIGGCAAPQHLQFHLYKTRQNHIDCKLPFHPGHGYHTFFISCSTRVPGHHQCLTRTKVITIGKRKKR